MLEDSCMAADQIEGWNALEEWFGYTPNFHDAEIISVDLRRDPAASIIRVHAWRTNEDLDANGYYRTDRHAIVSFEISGISEMHFEGWNHQNALSAMWIDRIKAGYEIHMPTSYGMDGRLVASAVKVSLEPQNV